ncbi:MAG: TIGR04053 family radical SAM/SPASM domain-containing protein [Candidatus Korarchaeum sp.]
MPSEGFARVDFNERPILVFWELTKACKLRCRHCRAEAIPEPLEDELSEREALKLLKDIRSFGEPLPVLILTGGDPLMRKDLPRIIGRAHELGIRMGIAPAVTDLLNEGILKLLSAYGLAVSLSLDGIGRTHDFIRNEDGNFGKTLSALKIILNYGLRVQVNTLVCKESVSDLPRLAKLLKEMGIGVWELFFLVKVGRGVDLEELNPEECEDVAHFLYEVSRYGIEVRTVEAPFFRRVVDARMREPADSSLEDVAKRYGLGETYLRLTGELTDLLGHDRGNAKVRPMRTRDGYGIVFISHNGDVYPSGFAPLKLGSIRERSLKRIYRDDEILRKIREAEFRGRCGRCEYRHVCGGSRARALASRGDILEEDPACVYEPPQVR